MDARNAGLTGKSRSEEESCGNHRRQRPHCEAGEAGRGNLPGRGQGDCFAALAMTRSAVIPPYLILDIGSLRLVPPSVSLRSFVDRSRRTALRHPRA